MYSSRNVLRQADSLNESLQSISSCIKALYLENAPPATSPPELIPRLRRARYRGSRNTHSLAFQSHHECKRLDAFFPEIRRSPPRPLSRTKTALTLYQTTYSNPLRPFTSKSPLRPGSNAPDDRKYEKPSSRDRNAINSRIKGLQASDDYRAKAIIADPGSMATAGKVQLMFDSKGLESAVRYNDKHSSQDGDLICIDVREARYPSRQERVEEDAQHKAEATNKFWDEYNLFEPDELREQQPSWKRTFEKLKKHTPLWNDQQEQFTVIGPYELLLVAYHHIRGHENPMVTPSLPLGHEDKAFMICSCPSKKVGKFLSSKTSPLRHPELRVLRSTARFKVVHTFLPYLRMEAEQNEPLGESVFDPMPSFKHFEPRHWNTANFAEHIKGIVSFRQPALLVEGVRRQERFSDALDQLFEEVGFAKYVFSYGAICDAISFMLKNARPRQARGLFERMKRKGYPPTMEVYNCFLVEAAKKYRFNLFNRFLDEALGAGLVFNENTWTAFALAALEDSQRHAVVKEALSRGFAASPTFAQDMAAIMVPYTLGPFLDSGGSVSDFVKMTDELYNGPHWLAGSAVHGIVDVLGGRGFLIEAVQTINNVVLARGVSLSRRSFHKLLAHSWLQQQDPDFGIWLVLYAEQHWGPLSQENVTFELLFNMAWKSCCYNLCRVIWVYSISSGRARYFMRWRVWDSLLKSQDPLAVDVNRWKVFRHHAGSVICGQQRSPLGAPSNAKAIVYGQRALLSKRPLLPFRDMLVEALLLDKTWATHEYDARRTDRAWLMRNVIQVPMTENRLFED